MGGKLCFWCLYWLLSSFNVLAQDTINDAVDNAQPKITSRDNPDNNDIYRTGNRYNPNVDRYNDPLNPNVDRYNTNVDRVGSNVDRYNTNVDRFGSNVDRYNTNVNRFGSNVDRYNSNVDRYKTNTERYNVNAASSFPRTTYYSSDTNDEMFLSGGQIIYNKNLNDLAIQPTYFVVASRIVRPGLIFQVLVSILQATQPVSVHASISRNGVEIAATSKPVKEGVSEILLMRIPPTSTNGTYKLRVDGLHNEEFGGIAFFNETNLVFDPRSMTILIQTDKPQYMQGDIVRFRSIPITTELKGFSNVVDVYMIDPKKHIMRRWLSRQSNLGSVSLEYKLSDQPTFGEWTIRVVAQGQIEEGHFLVEEYYQTRFEVNVTMPAFFFNTDPFIYGKVMANFTSGAPVYGNLTLRAIIGPVGSFDLKKVNEKFRTENSYFNIATLTSWNRPQQNQNNAFQNSYVVERHFNFDEVWPFWMEKPIGEQVYDPWIGAYKNTLPYLRFFNGTYDFKYPIAELERILPNNVDLEVMIVATVGEKFYEEIISGYSVARIFNSTIKLSFLEGSPQVFKPTMPFKSHIAVSFHDGSPIRFDGQNSGILEISGSIESKGGRRDYPMRRLTMSQNVGIWDLLIDLQNDFEISDPKANREFLTNIQSMKIYATYVDYRGEIARTELLLLNHFSPMHQHIRVSTSTIDPKVGEYIIFHIRCNMFMDTFRYLIVSKGIILISGEETIQEGIRTMAVTLNAEMAPTATIVVWVVNQKGYVVADSLTFPVNGISRNNFTVYINNRKARTGEKVEVAIFGEPGAYVGLSGIDNAFYTMQAGNELTYTSLMTKMLGFDESFNITSYKHTWRSREGNPDEFVYFPSASFAIDANRTFEFVGLIVFTDAAIPRRVEICNRTKGFADCLSGKCFPIHKQCDGILDCDDGSDERNCNARNETAMSEFRRYRFNRVKRHYENVWLWKDVNIGPHGRYIFNIEVPQIPAYWMVSSFSISPSKGFGMLKNSLQYVGVQPFFINLEMPSECREGEQVGIRVTVFNFMTNSIEATVVLHGSPDYKFVHVEEGGIVRSYNPRTSFGEHQFFVYLEAQQTSMVYIPIVPTRLGDIDVTIHAGTLLGTSQITRTIHVESDGLPQYRHQSILMDLSNRAYIFQYMHVNITETPIIPYQVERYFVYGSNKARISVVGDVVGPIFPTMPVNSTSLLYLPMESAEQNMFSLAANLYTIMYMRLINQRNKTLEKNAFYHLNVIYQRQLSFMKEDGSFTLFRSDWNNSDSSVWLTAYCARIFQEASFYEWENYIYIDPQIIQKSIQWLLQYQTPEGSFYDITWYPDRKMNKTFYQENTDKLRNISLTAHVIITLATVKDLSGSLGARVSLAQQRAVLWIERNIKVLQETKEPYEVAISAYALLLARAATAEQVSNILRRHARTIGEYTYWGNVEVPQPPSKLENQKYFSLPRLPYEYDSLNIETTAYALLVYTSRRELYDDSIVQWLNAQRLNDGGWASTQDTSVALKALIEYTVHSRIREVSSLTVTVEATSLPGQTKTFYINDNNLAQLQSIEIPNAWGTVKVQAKGAGYAILQMHVQYNVDIEQFQTKPPVHAFDLNTRALFHGRNQSHISLLACQRWTNTIESPRSGMSVLDVTIPTGYFIQQQKLDNYVLSQRVRNLQRAKYLERKVLFYFSYLDAEDVCVSFTVERWFPVANMSRYLPIRIYDYYAPERFNETIFDALPTYLLNICEVCGSSQCPYCPIYNISWQLLPHTFLFQIVLFTILYFFNFKL